MNRSIRLRSAVLVVVIGILAALSTLVIAHAAIPAADGTITGCYSNATVGGVHVLGVVDPTGTCPKNTTALAWSQAGPQGPPGVNGVQEVQQSFHLDQAMLVGTPGGVIARTLTCPAGRHALDAGLVSVVPDQAWVDAAASIGPTGYADPTAAAVMTGNNPSFGVGGAVQGPPGSRPSNAIATPNGRSSDGQSWLLHVLVQVPDAAVDNVTSATYYGVTLTTYLYCA